MRIRSPHALALAFAIGVAHTLLDAFPARAYCRATTNRAFQPSPDKPCDDVGKPLFWRSGCVGYDFQRDATARAPLADAERAGAAAFSAWANAACPSDLRACAGPVAGRPSIAATNLGPVACSRVEYSGDAGNANVVIFRDKDWPHGDRENSVALTTVHFDLDSGEIYDADVEINGTNVTTTDDPTSVGFDLTSILTHEAGHFLGLAHTEPDHREAVMLGVYASGSLARALAPDDVCAICNVYPPGRAAACDTTPRHGFASACRGEPGNVERSTDIGPPFVVTGGCSSSGGLAGGQRCESVALALSPALVIWVVIVRRRHRRASSISFRKFTE